MNKILLSLFLCLMYIHGYALSITNYVADTDFYTAYADDLDQEVESTMVLNRYWCDYLTNEDIEFGKRLAVLSRITHNSVEEYYDYETGEKGNYNGERNFKVYNAYILNKYKLGKIDYSKMSVYDAAIHNLLHQASSDYYYTGQKDLPLMKNLRENNKKSLALAMLEVSMDRYYFRGNTGFKKIFKQAQYIEDNYKKYNADIRLFAVQKILDKINEDNPCKGELVYDDALYCNCYSDDNDNLRSFDEKIKCLEDIQTNLKKNMNQTWDKGLDLGDDDMFWKMYSVDNWRLMKENALVWIDAEVNFINKLKYETHKETKIRQIISTQDVLCNVRTMSILWGLFSGGQSAYPDFIEERNPTFLEVYPNCQLGKNEDREFTMEELQLMGAEINRILNETYDKLGGESNKELNNAQSAWSKTNVARQKFWIEDKPIKDISSFDYYCLYLDPLISRIKVLESYLAKDNEIKEQYLYKYTYAETYHMLKK